MLNSIRKIRVDVLECVTRLLTNLVNLCAFLLVSKLGRFKEPSISGYLNPKISNTPCQQIFAHSQEDHNPWLYRGPKFNQHILGVGEQVTHFFFLSFLILCNYVQAHSQKGGLHGCMVCVHACISMQD